MMTLAWLRYKGNFSSSKHLIIMENNFCSSLCIRYFLVHTGDFRKIKVWHRQEHMGQLPRGSLISRVSPLLDLVHPQFHRQKNFLPPLAGLILYCRKKECFNRKSGGMKFFVGENGRTPENFASIRRHLRTALKWSNVH